MIELVGGVVMQMPKKARQEPRRGHFISIWLTWIHDGRVVPCELGLLDPFELGLVMVVVVGREILHVFRSKLAHFQRFGLKKGMIWG